jgi:hypothetical protein
MKAPTHPLITGLLHTFGVHENAYNYLSISKYFLPANCIQGSTLEL